MSDQEEQYPIEQRELRNAARLKAIESAQELWDSYGVVDEDYSGAVVTGYVLVAEAVLPSGYTSIAWCAGNGQPPSMEGTGYTGLAAHRVDGMVRAVIRSVDHDTGATE